MVFFKPVRLDVVAPELKEDNGCSRAPNVYCFSIENWDCCDMLYNSRMALNMKDNPRMGLKFTGNRLRGWIYNNEPGSDQSRPISGPGI